MYRQGLGELNARIGAAHAAMTRRARLERMLAGAREERGALEHRLAKLAGALDKEQKDVDRLQGKGLAALFHAMLGSKEERLDIEKQELLAARLAHEETAAELARIAEREAAMLAEIAALEGAEKARAELLAEKQAWLEKHGGPAAEELFAMAEEIGRLEALLREIDEACAQGNQARTHLHSIRRSLSGAQSWGVLDMFGGGFMATRVKHDRIDEARARLPDAQVAIMEFQRELADVEMQIAIELDIPSFSRFADHFFDGLIFDWRVQSKIKKSHDSVIHALAQVSEVLERLEKARAPLATRLDAMTARRTELIETW
jgi:hypothetical protein